MKKLNYYEVHKNKNPKRKLGNSIPELMIAVNKAIVCAMEVSRSLMELYNAQKKLTSIFDKINTSGFDGKINMDHYIPLKKASN